MSTEAINITEESPSSGAPEGARLRWGLALAGPAALGVVLATRDVGAVSEVLRLPVLWVGVAALMTPALYIGAALSGLAPSARDVGRVALDSLARGGGLLLGLAPALLFLVVTSFSDVTAQLLIGAAAFFAAFSSLAVLFRHLCVEPDAGVLPRFVFMGWAAVLLGIGAQLFTLGA